MTRPLEPGPAALVELAQSEFRAGRYRAAEAVARLARFHAPDEPEPQRLVAIASTRLTDDALTARRQLELAVALGDAYRILGEFEISKEHYRQALALDPRLTRAHEGLSAIHLFGDDYYSWLKRLHRAIRPDVYVEIGIADGFGIALAQPPTIAVGVDPSPKASLVLQTETRIFPETSDAFFARRRLESILAGKPLKLAFIDGLHTFEQVLRDFIHLEQYCDSSSAVLIHDTLPLDEATQTRERQTEFWTGDVWKAVVCLKHYRPELDIFTVTAPPTGLTIVTGLDRGSTILADIYPDAVSTFIHSQFPETDDLLFELINAVPNEWASVTNRLRLHDVL